ELLQVGESLEMRGTILLSQEGINIALSGSRESVDLFGKYLAEDERFADIQFKESLSEKKPFRRFRVRIKDEIIKLGVPQIKPEQHTVPHLSPEAFAQWMDEGRDITLLDTRNAYEVQIGTFDGALNLNIDTFTEFPEAVEAQIEDKEKPVVMFCTGGVRCEKAGPLLESQGFKEVYQLDGGILKYLEKCGGKHWHGECFVFDDRLAVDERLEESREGYCPDCVKPLPDELKALPQYERVKVCPYCHGDDGVERHA
ncbi:MAG: pseudouridine synthase, partial [Legionellaceae bacterium]|nr:pseudouridine synthase [Legionellaceae bacterium]